MLVLGQGQSTELTNCSACFRPGLTILSDLPSLRKGNTSPYILRTVWATYYRLHAKLVLHGCCCSPEGHTNLRQKTAKAPIEQRSLLIDKNKIKCSLDRLIIPIPRLLPQYLAAGAFGSDQLQILLHSAGHTNESIISDNTGLDSGRSDFRPTVTVAT